MDVKAKQNQEDQATILQLRQELATERAQRRELDTLLELKIQEMFLLNAKLEETNANLEAMVSEKTSELEASLTSIKELAESKRQFVANMSHELRTPLNSIIGLLHVLRADVVVKELSEDDKEKYLAQMEVSAKRLLTHLTRILDYSQIADKPLDSRIEAVELQAMMNSFVAHFAQQSLNKNLAMKIRVHDSVPQTLEIDVGNLAKIADVLIENAVNYTDSGEVDIELRSEQEPIHNRRQLVLEVKDTGPGIKQEKLAQIFSAFSQDDNSDHRQYGGLGLGLTLASRIADQIQAQIQVESTLGEGTVFQVRYMIPETVVNLKAFGEFKGQNQSSITESVENGDVIATVKAHAPSLRVLAVDDDEGNLLVMKASLARMGISCKLARNGQESLEAIQSDKNLNLILMDCQMPVMDGLEATRKLREAGHSATIIAVTANATDDNRETCLGAGMNGFVAKPFSLKTLAEALNDSLFFIEA